MSRTVLRLRIHPVKGARGFDVESMDFDETGPCLDRRWMVVRGDGRFISQRDTPALATVKAAVAGSDLILSAPGAEEVAVPVTPEGERIRVQVWDSVLTVPSVSPAADQWLSAVLGARRRLVHIGDDDVRRTDPAYAADRRVGFADGFPALLVSQGSVDELARRVGREIPMERFRPNILVGGEEPHEEDTWRRFTIGRMRFSGVKLCTRCKVTTLDQESGVRDRDREPLRTLATYRHLKDKVYFGLNVIHHGTGRISAGDPVEPSEVGFVPGA
ncbi:MAG: MOSC domain-containing protein [Gemmatimonadetes bacterium]|nr:MOSC domain-containing protein [Gemmatimonadota bacterium]MYI05973.1 MOSC domain-containing protein [Gemmatimonadota bacterium]